MSIRKNFSWMLIGNSIFYGCQYLVLVVLAKLSSPEIVGQYALGLAITAPVILFTNLQLKAIQVADSKEEYKFGHYLSLRVLSSVAAITIIAAIILYNNYEGKSALVILLVGLAKIVESVSEIIHGLFQRYERLNRVACALILRGIISLAMLSLCFWITKNIVIAVVAKLLANLLVFVFYDVPSLISFIQAISGDPLEKVRSWSTLLKMFLSWDWPSLGSLARLAFPMGLTAMIISLNGNIPRYFIESFIGTRALGIYAAIASLMTTGGMIINPLSMSVTPRQARYYAWGNKKSFVLLLGKLLSFAAGLGICGIMVAWLGGKYILTLLFSVEYSEHTDVLLLLMVAAAVSYLNFFLGSSMTAAHYFGIQLPLFSIINIILVLGCYFLIPSYGLPGAALAVLLSQISQMILSGLLVITAIRRLA